MSLHVYYDDEDIGVHDLTAYIRRDTLALTEQAEEGSVGISTITFDDPDMILNFDGHRPLFILEDEDTTGDTVFFFGYTYNQRIKRGPNILGRIWEVDVSDANALWQRRIMTGSDTKRGAETDVARMQWLLATNEATGFTDVATYVSTATTGAMDAAPYRGQTFSQVADDCAQVKGKNWFAFGAKSNLTAVKPPVYAWYGKDDLTTYSSPFTITNDPTLINESTVWAGDQEATLTRDVERIYWAVYMPYDGGAVYRTLAATAAHYAKRDFAAPSINVKSRAKAQARGDRMLTDLATPDLRLKLTVVKVPPAAVNGFKAGMRIQVQMTEMEEASFLGWWRIVSRTPQQVGDGTYYDVELELVFSGPYVAGGGGISPPDEAILYRTTGHMADAAPNVRTTGTGDLPPGGFPSAPLIGPFEYITDGTLWKGIRCLASGNVDVTASIGSAAVYSGAVTVTYSLLLNGVAIDTDSHAGSGFFNPTGHLSALGVAVVNGDEFTLEATNTLGNNTQIGAVAGEHSGLFVHAS